MRAGALDRVITIIAVTETQDDTGASVTVQTAIGTDVPAEVRYDDGLENTEGRAEQARATVLFRIRWRNDVTNKCIISFKRFAAGVAELYDILSVKELGRQEGLEIRSVARVA